MCGLFVVVQRGTPVSLERALQSTRKLQHRGPDGWHHTLQSLSLPSPEGPVPLQVFMGHTRLAIQDPQARSDQPLQRGDHTLAYNGEVYNYRALRAQLAGAGDAFSTEGDTEVLLALLRRQGVQGLADANGQWAFCLLDAAAGTLTAARDRYGKKPLFWYANAQTVCLASEIAPILHYLGRAPRMQASALHQFLRWGWLYPQSDGATHVEGIRQVRAGAALHVDLARWQWREDTWFDLAQHVAHTPAPTDLAATLEDAVRQRLVSDRRVGLLLSGGVDSSLLLAVLHHMGVQDQVTCFTGDAGKSDDARYAEACITQLGIHAVRLPLDYSATGMDAFLNVCRHQEKPFPLIGNVLAMPQMYAEIARHDVPVVLDGTGADEVFAGYWDRYARFAVCEAVQHGDEAWTTTLLEANADHPRVHTLLQQALAAARNGTAPAAPSPGIQGLEGDPAGLDALLLHPQVHTAPPVDPLRMFAGGLGDALVLDAQHGRLLEWLWHNDRNAMAFGIENRSPFLDHRLAPCMGSGLQGKFNGPWNKFALRQLFDAFAPALPTQWRRDKQGFRWVYHRFLQQNKDQVLALVAASEVLAQCVDVAALVDAARRDEAWLESSLLQRALSVAGVAQAMGATR
jgi:asparagine synthase (glutamine-hydrolysing)